METNNHHVSVRQSFGQSSSVVSDTSRKKVIISFLLGLIIGFGSFWLWGKQNGALFDTVKENDSLANTANVSDTQASDRYNHIIVREQTAGASVVLTKIIVSQSTWVAIHEDVVGVPGNILGATRLDAGEHSFITVDLLRRMKEGNTYYAALRIDDGLSGFDLEKDIPLLDAAGTQIMETFTTWTPLSE